MTVSKFVRGAVPIVFAVLWGVVSIPTIIFGFAFLNNNYKASNYQFVNSWAVLIFCGIMAILVLIPLIFLHFAPEDD